MQVAPGRRVGQGLKVLVRWASAAPLTAYRWLAIWWLSLKASHPLYPRDWDVEGVVSAPERLNDAPPSIFPHGGHLVALCRAISEVTRNCHLPRWVNLTHLPRLPERTARPTPHAPPREERQEVVASMREIGMSTRAIVAATGTSKGTVDRELSRAPSGAPGSSLSAS